MTNWETHDNSQPFPDDARALEVLARLPDPRPERTAGSYLFADLLEPRPNRSIQPADSRGMIRGVFWGLFWSAVIGAIGWVVWEVAKAVRG